MQAHTDTLTLVYRNTTQARKHAECAAVLAAMAQYDDVSALCDAGTFTKTLGTLLDNVNALRVNAGRKTLANIGPRDWADSYRSVYAHAFECTHNVTHEACTVDDETLVVTVPNATAGDRASKARDCRHAYPLYRKAHGLAANAKLSAAQKSEALAAYYGTQAAPQAAPQAPQAANVDDATIARIVAAVVAALNA